MKTRRRKQRDRRAYNALRRRISHAEIERELRELCEFLVFYFREADE